MGLFGPYKYKSKKTKEEFYLHIKEVGNTKLYFFSKDPIGAISSLPRGYEVVENNITGVPFLRKKVGAGLFGKKSEKQMVGSGSET